MVAAALMVVGFGRSQLLAVEMAVAVMDAVMLVVLLQTCSSGPIRTRVHQNRTNTDRCSFISGNTNPRPRKSWGMLPPVARIRTSTLSLDLVPGAEEVGLPSPFCLSPHLCCWSRSTHAARFGPRPSKRNFKNTNRSARKQLVYCT